MTPCKALSSASLINPKITPAPPGGGGSVGVAVGDGVGDGVREGDGDGVGVEVANDPLLA